jgi:DnaJ-class molecular chaperone
VDDFFGPISFKGNEKMNERRFWQAHEQHYRIPDEPETQECETCLGRGKITLYAGHTNGVPNITEEVECDDCEGFGEVPYDH